MKPQATSDNTGPGNVSSRGKLGLSKREIFQRLALSHFLIFRLYKTLVKKGAHIENLSSKNLYALMINLVQVDLREVCDNPEAHKKKWEAPAEEYCHTSGGEKHIREMRAIMKKAFDTHYQD